MLKDSFYINIQFKVWLCFYLRTKVIEIFLIDFQTLRYFISNCDDLNHLLIFINSIILNSSNC